MLPELIEGHTIHIAAYHSAWKGKPASAWHAMPEHGGITIETEMETQRKVFRYFRERGIDVTCEGMNYDFIGLQPLIWWYHKSKRWQMTVPERLCVRGRTTHLPTHDFRFTTSMHGEEIFVKDKENLPGFLDQFCQQTLPWYYLSQLDRMRLSAFGTLTYSDGVVARWEGFQRILRRGKLILRRGDDLFIPALWRDDKTIIAYSRKGYADREWLLPDDWAGVKDVDISVITLNGLVPMESGMKIENGKIQLSLLAGQAVMITPHYINKPG
jgi:hypothetical protein